VLEKMRLVNDTPFGQPDEPVAIVNEQSTVPAVAFIVTLENAGEETAPQMPYQVEVFWRVTLRSVMLPPSVVLLPAADCRLAREKRKISNMLVLNRPIPVFSGYCCFFLIAANNL